MIATPRVRNEFYVVRNGFYVRNVTLCRNREQNILGLEFKDI